MMLLLILIGANITCSFAELNYDYYLHFTNDQYGRDIFNYYQMPKTYTLKENIYFINDELGSFDMPQDLYIDSEDNVFIADTNNNRIIKYNNNLEFEMSFDDFDEKGLRHPEGVFVDNYGEVFIADTENNRVVHLGENGEFIEEFTKPISEFLPEDMNFSPRKVAVSPTGNITVMRHQWLMNIDVNNSFRGYVGTTKVDFDLTYIIKRIFSNEKQKMALKKQEPESILNFHALDNGLIYVTTAEETGQLKKLNAKGANIFPKETAFADSFYYGSGNELKAPNFVDLTVSNEELVFMLESWSGIIYVYDNMGENITMFGEIGDEKYNFKNPVAIDVDSKNNVYVLDAGTNSLKVFEPTDFMNMVVKAIDYYNDGDYENDIVYWKKVLSMSETYKLANKGIARSLFKSGDYSESMEYYKVADDRKGYTKAFEKYRYETFRNNFFLVVILIIGLAILTRYLLKLYNFFVEKEIEKYHNVI